MTRRACARVRLVAPVVVLGALALAACGGPAAHPAATTSTTTIAGASTSTTLAGTQQIRFDPYTSGGTAVAGLHVTQTVTGTCVAAGVAGNSSFRCFAQPSAVVYDPCFVPPHATSGPLLCVADPAVPDAVEFDLGPLPSPASGAPAARPWAMELANGQVCVLVNAAWDGLGPFACPVPGSGPGAEADCHAPEARAPTWRAECQAEESASSAFEVLPVVRVWT